MPFYKKSVKLGLSGEAEMIGRLCATRCGVAQCVVGAFPEPRDIPIHDVFGYAAFARIIDGPRAGLEGELFEPGEPTF